MKMRYSKTPELIMLCGPNGAGKSTLTSEVRQKNIHQLPLVDPDKIAKDRHVSPIEAGRIATAFIRENIAKNLSFIRESTLTAKFDFQMIKAAKESGFKVILIYVGLNSVDIAIDRVQQRYAKGGHSVPEEDIRRRYLRSLENLPEAIRQVDRAVIFDNSRGKYKQVAVFEKGRLISHISPPEWFKETFKTFLTPKKKERTRSSSLEL